MGYNNTNILKKIVEIQDITIEYKKHGSSQKWIYENIIRDRFFISFATYNRYLGVPAKRYLGKMKLNETKNTPT
jgi:hypothetical protein